MAESIGNAYVNIVPKAPGIEGQIDSLLGGPAASAGSSAGGKAGAGLLSSLKGVLTVAAVGKVLKDAFDAGGALEQSFGGLETIYGDAADQAKEFAMQAASAGISANDYAEQAVSFGAALKQAFGGDTTAAVEAANTAIMDMADNSAKMGTDIGSLQAAYQGFAKQNYTMLDNLKLGYGGTKTEMERLLADAEKLTGVKYDINNLGDVYSAIHAVQTELGLTGVAAQEAGTTLSGSFNAVKASWENVLAALMTGEGLDTALSNLITSFSAFGDNVLSMIGNLAPQLPGLITQLVEAIIQMAPDFIATGLELIVQLGVGLAQAFPEIAAMIPGLLASAVEAFFSVDWLSVGSQIIQGVCQGIWDAGAALFDALGNLARQALAAAKSALGIGSPSKLFADEVGHWLPAGMAVGIEDNLQPITLATDEMAASAVSTFDQATAPGSTLPRTAPAPVSSLDTSATGRQEQRTAIFMLNGREFARAIYKDLNEVTNDHGFQLVIA